MRLLGVLVLLSSCSCPRAKAPEWPEFPASDAARAALIKQWTQREVAASPEVTPELVFQEAERRGWSNLLPLPSGPSGEGRGEGIHPTVWLLFGTFHDSAGQIDAFRRLLKPGAFTHVALEQLRADGHWSGINRSQSGDSTQLARFLSTGDRAAWDELSRVHEEHDYTSWKYGYAQNVMDVVVTARGLGMPALGCDLPDALLPSGARDGATPPEVDDEVMRLRELHCFLSIRDSLAGAKGRVAMLWGQAHVRREGFRRFLPPGDQVLSLYAIGARHSADAPDELLRNRLILNDPVLVPLSDGEAALLIPDSQLGGQLERVRTKGEARPGIRISATTPGTFKVREHSIQLTDVEARVALQPGAYTYSFESNGLRVVGNAQIPAGGEVELSFDVPARSTRMVEIGPLFP
jgi:hypothetical protein